MNDISSTQRYLSAKVMIVDDEPTTIEALQALLEDEGYSKIVGITDATQVLSRVALDPPDAILLDLNMPGVSGIEILRTLRADQRYEKLQIIIFTASTDDRMRRIALKLGANDLVTKPANPSLLALRLRNALIAMENRDRFVSSLVQMEIRAEERTHNELLARATAEDASRVRDEFIENLGREVRGRLEETRDRLRGVLADTRLASAPREALGAAVLSSERLVRVAGGLVAVAELDAGRMQTAPQTVDLVALAVEAAAATGERENREIRTSCNGPMPTRVRSDGPRLREAIGRGLDGAIDLGDAGEVALSLEYDQDRATVVIDVTFAGEEILPSRLPGLFLDFEAAGQDGAQSFGHRGLAFGTARRLARLLGGECSLENEDTVQRRLRISLPAPLTEDATLRCVDDAEIQRLYDAIPGEFAFDRASESGMDSNETASPELEHKRATIMLVDDEVTTLDVIEAFLEGEGYQRFIRTSDSREAMELAARHKPDILLLDLNMPHVSGLEILSGIRANSDLQHLPVVILTASTDTETKLKALELGASDFLSKPVDASELALRLHNTLAAKAYQDRLAYIDALTGLPNRGQFLEHLEGAVRRAARTSVPCAVLHIGLDRFKQINDTLGHGAGDQLLIRVAERLQGRVDGKLSRVGGDEFGLILPSAKDTDRIARSAQRIVEGLAEPFVVNGRDLFVTCSVGIAVYPTDGEDIDTLLKHATAATSNGKQAGVAPYQFYRESLGAEAAQRIALESELRGAIDCDEMRLFYQPVLDVRTGAIVGAEALLRWKHPERGLLMPDEFIGIAEESGIILRLGDWVIEEACRQARRWIDDGSGQLQMAVNLSSSQFRTGRLVETIRSAMAKSGIAGSQLTFELTERQIMENADATTATLREMREMGVKISVDDFGTGHSSLTYLKRFPIDELKIDRSFVSGIPGDCEDLVIVQAIVGLAHNLGLSVVAEGVETPEQLDFMREHGCDVYQGYLFSRPVPAIDWPDLLEKSGSGS